MNKTDLPTLEPTLRRLARTITSRPADQDDIVSEVWVYLLEHPNTTDPTEADLTRLCRNAHARLARATTKARGAGSEPLRRLLAPGPPPVDADELARALAALSPRLRRLLVLKASGYSFTELAVKTGLTAERVQFLIKKTRADLSHKLDPDNDF